mmetsp:Transcript_72889/g.211005  ORF Transcript_72889/g.211005 Transcript_72889/m.211005 type:complete len:201 (-) Transcript_72889:208-810(-)
MTSICSFRSARSLSHSSLFLSISACSSSTRSLNLPHCRDMVSCKRPQLGLPSVHFFHCVEAGGSSFTGSGFGVSPAFAALVVVDAVVVGSCSSPASTCKRAVALPPAPKAKPRAMLMACLAPGVMILFAFACTFGSAKFSSKPACVLQTRIGAEALPPPRACCKKKEPSLHFVKSMMKSNTAKSFLLIVISASFSALIFS